MFQLSVGLPDQHQRDEEGQQIRHRHGVEHTVQPEEPGQQQGEAHAEHHFPDHGQCRGFRRFAHSLQKDEAGLVDAGQDDEAEIDPERFEGKVGVVTALVGGAKNRDELPGEELRQHKFDPLGKKGKIVYMLREKPTSELNNLSFCYVSSLIAAIPLMLLRLFLYFPS